MNSIEHHLHLNYQIRINPGLSSCRKRIELFCYSLPPQFAVVSFRPTTHRICLFEKTQPVLAPEE